MEIKDAGRYIAEILSILDTKDKNKIKDLQSIVPLRVYMQSIIRIEKERKLVEKINLIVSVKTPEGMKKISLFEDSSFVFHKLLMHLQPILTKNLLLEYHEVTTKFLQHSYSPSALKIQLLDIEREILYTYIEYEIQQNNISEPFYRVRYETYSNVLNNNEILLNSDKSVVENVLNETLSKVITNYIFKGEILQSHEYLMKLLINSQSHTEQRVTLQTLVWLSTSYQITGTEALLLIVDDYESIFSKDEFDDIRQRIKHLPVNIDMSEFSISSPGELKASSSLNKHIYTLIHFSIPNRASNLEIERLETDNKEIIEISPISAFFYDPIFRTMPSWNLGGVSWNHICDLEPNHSGNYCHISIVVPSLYVPHLNLTETGFQNIDFSDKYAEMGREFHPYKTFVVQILRKNYDLISPFVDIKYKDININLFSNYIVRCIDNSISKEIYRIIYALTNPDSFSQSAGKFIAKINSANLNPSINDIKILLSSTVIKSEKNLAEFVYKLFDLIVKNSIELQGHYADTWKDQNTPKSEPNLQPTIFNLIRIFLNMSGIQISRESIVSNGQIDFLISYTLNNNDLLNVAVELKLAHADVEKGINYQLPIYMKGLSCNYGIFIVLWFKNDKFKKPSNFDSINQLDEFIKSKKLNPRIMDMIIDCTKPVSPSKLTAR